MSMEYLVITLFPEMIDQALSCGVVGRAIEKNIIQVRCLNPRDFCDDERKTVDDRPYGGGPGMVMQAEPLARAIDEAKSQLGDDAPVIYMSCQGEPLHQQRVGHWAGFSKMILLCGRYEGVDERLLESYVDFEISIGDYVLSGGELAACVLIDVLSRQQPGVLGHPLSYQQDSFVENVFDCPHYTRPPVWRGMKVPGVLTSGNHRDIESWRARKAQDKTQKIRPDGLSSCDLNQNHQKMPDGAILSEKNRLE